MATTLDWRYHRPGCTSCKKTEAYLEAHSIGTDEVRSTSRDRIEGEAALELLDGIDTLVVAKGRKIVRFDLTADRPSDEELLGHMLGRSGALRAPSFRTGRTFVVGYNGDLLDEVLG